MEFSYTRLLSSPHTATSTSRRLVCDRHYRFILPIEGVGLILWWIVEEIVTKQSTWWQIEKDTLATTLMEWAIVLLLVIGLNWWMGPLKITEPRNYYTRKVLGLFFKLTPRRRYYSSQDKPTYYHATSNDVSGVE